MARLTPALASRFAGLALGHVAREYPHKLDHVLDGDADARTPRALHPIFFGSFDWHSCVHGYWLLARLLRAHPELPEAPAIRAQLAAALTPANAAAELAYARRPSAAGFERPYGWAWLLALDAELARHDTPWARMLHPLAAHFAGLCAAHLPVLTYPIRTGSHGNTAFALTLIDGWARRRDAGLAALIADRARDWFGRDRDAQAWEPSGDDFLSPTLCEAVLLQRVLPEAEFAAWFAGFLPRLAQREPATLFAPAHASDRRDGKLAHLDGLNLSRAWCWALLVPGDPVAAAHFDAALPHLGAHYAGEHWLATFALLALTGLD